MPFGLIRLFSRLFGKMTSDTLRQANWRDPSLIFLVLANLVPIFGVWFWHWQVVNLLLLYWAESAVIGFYNIIKIFVTDGRRGTKVVVSFCFQFSIFMFLHLCFLLFVFSGFEPNNFKTFPLREVQQTLWSVIPLVVSHGVSFFSNFIAKKEYLQTTGAKLLAQPFGRVALMQITIIFGSFFVVMGNLNIVALFILVGLKMFIDIFSHTWQHQQSQLPKRQS